MRRIRFVGLVRLANQVQRALRGPITAEHRDRMRREVSGAVEMVDKTLRPFGGGSELIPGPSRRAYDLLRALDVDLVQTAVQPDCAPIPEQIRLPGVTAQVKWLAERLAETVLEHGTDPEELFGQIQSVARDAERSVAGLEPIQLTPRTREHLAWLRFLAMRKNFSAYIQAVKLASTIFGQDVPSNWSRPVYAQFRPNRTVCRLASDAHRTLVVLPTEALGFDQRDLVELSRAVLGSRSRRRRSVIRMLVLREPYQKLQAQLEELAGSVEEPYGMTHDLERSFRRVNTKYFGGKMSRPRLTWNRCITSGKFGHYEFATNRVTISRALDRPGIPEFVLDHCMHHELLHKKHGVRWYQGRCHTHTSDFRREERRFVRYGEAEAFLRALAEGNR